MGGSVRQCNICMVCGLSFVAVIAVGSVVESQKSGEGDDVTDTAWHVGQQLSHFRAVPRFCAPS